MASLGARSQGACPLERTGCVLQLMAVWQRKHGLLRSCACAEPLPACWPPACLPCAPPPAQVANQHGLKRVAFPAISCGAYGYPFEEAAEVCGAWLEACWHPGLGCTRQRSMRVRHPLPARVLQIAVRTAAVEAGALEEVAFMLFEQQALDAWLAAARMAGLEEAEEEGGGHGEL